MRQRFKLNDYDIEVDYGSHVVHRLYDRFDGYDTGYLDYVLELFFTDKAVSDFLINDVRIGEDVVVIDEDSGISFAMNIGSDTFYIKTIYNSYEDTMRIGDMQKVLNFGRQCGLRVREFRRKERVYA